MRYFNQRITSAAAFVDALDLSSISRDLEGYRFTSADGRELQIVRANAPSAGVSSYYYAPRCGIAEVRDALGSAVEFSAEANSVSVTTAPRYIFCA